MAQVQANKSSNNLTMDKKILGKDNYLRAYTSNVCDMSMPIELGISDQTVPTMNLILSPIRMKNPKLRPKSNAVNPSYASRTTTTAALIALRGCGSKFEAAAIASLNETTQLQLKLSLQKGWIRKLGIEKKVVNFFINKAIKKKMLEMQTEIGENEAARPLLNRTFNKEKTSKTTSARRRLDTTFSVMKSSQGQRQGVLTKTELNTTFLVASNSGNISNTAQLFNTKNQTNKLPLRPSSMVSVSVTASSASMGFNIR